MGDSQPEATHSEPIWRGRADFIIATQLSEDEGFEQLWAKQVDDDRFEICCIPFFAYDLALGDVVETDENRVVQRVIDPSGRFVFRVWFGESESDQEAVVKELEALGGLVERSSAVAVDAVDERMGQQVADVLDREERSGDLRYETGRSVEASGT